MCMCGVCVHVSSPPVYSVPLCMRACVCVQCVHDVICKFVCVNGSMCVCMSVCVHMKMHAGLHV